MTFPSLLFYYEIGQLKSIIPVKTDIKCLNNLFCNQYTTWI